MLVTVVKKNFFKLMINSVYGKTRNSRKRIIGRQVNNEKDFLNTLADQLISSINALIKIMQLFMKLSQI